MPQHPNKHNFSNDRKRASEMGRKGGLVKTKKTEPFFRLVTEYSGGRKRSDDFRTHTTAWLYATSLYNNGPLGVERMAIIEMPKRKITELELPVSPPQE